ncbi:alpha/beta fold hydrolase [Bordetella petrii]|uniref:alpha/beta fold hydrolase n=1 Tax=Bordetella petrii TaxID=94624 RepID=UPI001E3F3206|nr:alpha/beta hydrolase [Bordetella petrii]MCD0503865.1 alpha/beta hydrolase [Bordetella petrii]
MTTPSPPFVQCRYVQADGLRFFYREAGNPQAPVLLLLHGFPSSSHQFRNLMPLLARHFHVVAPDLPGFGFTEVPPARGYRYTFDNLALSLEAFVDQLGLARYALFFFDYGAPVGLRLALSQPERVSGLVSQNGNAYLEGLDDETWKPLRAAWADPSPANRQALHDSLLNFEATKWQYVHGETEPDRVPPESYTLDAALMERPGNKEIQLDLLLDYGSNLALYPAFQAFFRSAQLPTLVFWGRNDPFFADAGAEAYRRDNPGAVVEMLDAGHFALETHGETIGRRIVETLGPLLQT